MSQLADWQSANGQPDISASLEIIPVPDQSIHDRDASARSMLVGFIGYSTPLRGIKTHADLLHRHPVDLFSAEGDAVADHLSTGLRRQRQMRHHQTAHGIDS